MARPVRTPSSPDLRVEISKVAESLFAERGFDGTSLRDIAQQVGTTKALVYHYFRNKEALYLSLLEAAVSEVVTRVEEVAAGDGLAETKVRRVVHVFLEVYHTHPQRFQMVQRAIEEHGAAAATLAERWFSREHLALQAIAEEGVEQGIFKPLPPPVVPFIVIGLIIHALRGHKLRERANPNLAGTYPLDGLAELILTLLKADEAKQKRDPSAVRPRQLGRAAGAACPTRFRRSKKAEV